MEGDIGTIRVLLVDEQPVVRDGLAASLGRVPGMAVSGEAATLDEAAKLISLSSPDVVLLDPKMSGMRGAEACTELVRRYPELRVIVLSSATDEASIVTAFRAGARGFVLKASDSCWVRHGVRAVATGGVFVDPRSAGQIVSLAILGLAPRGPHGLTAREMRVLRLLPKGYSNRDIAGEHGVSVETVKTQVRSILRKLEVADRVAAATIAIREGLA